MERRLTNYSNSFDKLMVFVMVAALAFGIVELFNITNVFNYSAEETLIYLTTYTGLLIALVFRFETYYLEKLKFSLPALIAVIPAYLLVSAELAAQFFLLGGFLYFIFRDDTDEDLITNTEEHPAD